MRASKIAAVLLGLLTASIAAGQSKTQRISLDDSVILVGSGEPSYVQYGARDLGNYLTQITGNAVNVRESIKAAQKAKVVIVVGREMAEASNADLSSISDFGDEGSVIRTFDKVGGNRVVIAGLHPQGTNTGLATFLPMIHAEGKSAYLDGPLDLRNRPSIAVRGIHLNGWPVGYPYAFRSWKEEDWKRFVDIAWAQRANLLFLWPFMEIIPTPLSAEDEAYLQEVRRVVDYAENKRGMNVWIMQSANRIGLTNCGSPDPRFRTYWVLGECQQDMNPADPAQFARIQQSFEAFYRIVNNASAFCMIDSDPGSWPDSPLSDQVKIFQMARKLLDRYSVHGQETKLVDWMWIGWGHNFSKNMSENVAFMEDTIRNFKRNLAEPWDLIAGMSPYLEAAKKEWVLNKTTYLNYGAIEMEPAFPATNLGLQSVREVFDKAANYPELKGVMGNNELMSLQFPRTFYFLGSAWSSEYENQLEPKVLNDLAAQLYPDHQELIREAYLGLRATDPEKIKTSLDSLNRLVASGNAGHPGPIGRFLFPDQFTVMRNLQLQLRIRAARQSLIKAMQGTPDVAECSRLLENYFAQLLGWNQETGWDKMIDINIWNAPIYDNGEDLAEARAQLRKVLAQGKPYTTYTQIDEFFDPIRKNLLQTYGRDSVMIGCIDPFKLAVVQGK